MHNANACVSVIPVIVQVEHHICGKGTGSEEVVVAHLDLSED